MLQHRPHCLCSARGQLDQIELHGSCGHFGLKVHQLKVHLSFTVTTCARAVRLLETRVLFRSANRWPPKCGFSNV